MADIREICKRYDCAAAVVLHRPGHAEYDMIIDPSYSAAFLENGNFLRVRIKKAEVGPDRAKQLAEGTANMFSLMAVSAGNQALQLLAGADMIEKHYGDSLEHTTLEHTGDTRRRMMRSEATNWIASLSEGAVVQGDDMKRMANFILELTNDIDK